MDTFNFYSGPRKLATCHWTSNASAAIAEDLGLPKFISRDITNWLNERLARDRENSLQLWKAAGVSNLKEAASYSRCLSVIDTFWISNDPEEKWIDISLFRNKFSEEFQAIAFTGKEVEEPIPRTLTPELTLGGTLRKFWRLNSIGTMELVKAGSYGFSNTGNEPYCEVMVSQILSALDYPHVQYTLGREDGVVVSICESFIPADEIYVPYGILYPAKNLSDFIVDEGIDFRFRESVAQHMILDYLIGNSDRHSFNLGFFCDPKRDFKITRMAPIFDNGAGLLSYWSGAETIHDYFHNINHGPVLYESYVEGAELGKALLRDKHNVERLLNFTFNRAKLGDYSEQRINIIEKWLRRRVENFLSM